MVFSYHQDPPNWHLHLQQNLQQENITTNDNPHFHQQLPPLPPPSYTGGGSGGDNNNTGSIRHEVMSDRARLAKLPHLEVASIKCPRCQSTNTKFCYYNNYSLAQPRHVCKACRRYWTIGGTLRNVPVGGGCRKNKKTKSSSSKSKGGSASNSSTTSSDPRVHAIITSSDVAPNDNYMRVHQNNYQQLPLFSSLQNLTHFGGLNNMDQGQTSNMVTGDHQWSSMHMQQFPFMAGGFDESHEVSRVCDQVSAGAVKREETLNSGKAAARPFLGIVEEQYYNASWGGTWNNATGSGDGHDDQMPPHHSATAHFL